MLRLAFAEAGIGVTSRCNIRPERSGIPLFFGIGRHSGRWRDFPSNRATDELLRGNTEQRTRTGSRPTRLVGPPIINDLTFPDFLKNLRIRLPSWKPKSLQEEMDLQSRQSDEQWGGRGNG